MTDINKILGQATVDTATASALYTVPEGSSAVVASLLTVNTADADCEYSIYAIPSTSSTTTTLNPASFMQLGSDIDGEAADDHSGKSVSLSADGSIVAIGANSNDGNGSFSGHVRVYEWNGSAWVQLGSDIDGEAAGDFSGESVSLSSDGDTVAIGARFNDGNGNGSGHVRVYEWNSGTSSWDQKGADIDGEAAYDNSGYSVSLSSDGSIVAIGALYNDGNGVDAGHVRVYEWNGTSWVQKGADIDGEAANDESGVSVSLSSDGTIVATGAWLNDGNGDRAGHVRVYEWNSGTSSWDQKGADIDGEAAGDQSGRSVSLSADGDIVAIGALYNNGSNGLESGHVRVYEWSGSAWVQLGSDIDGEAIGDQSGWSVSLSSDGTRVAIGARANDGSASNAGHVRFYEWSGSAWVQQGGDIDGEASTDTSGESVSLSADGTTVAIGAINNDGSGGDAGHVRVYKYTAPIETYSADEKHALIKSQSILTGEHHEVQGGIVLGSGDAIWIGGTDEVSVSLYGVEIS